MTLTMKIASRVVPMGTSAGLVAWLGLGWGLAATFALFAAFLIGAEVGYRDGRGDRAGRPL